METHLIFYSGSKSSLGPKQITKRSFSLLCREGNSPVVIPLDSFLKGLKRKGGAPLKRVTGRTKSIIEKAMPPLDKKDIEGSKKTGFCLNDLFLDCWASRANFLLAA